MVTDSPGPTRRRRHGAELESALLTATWDELVEVGYGRLTMESVARRAGTSEPVLYRRWPNKSQLVLSALEQYRKVNPIAEPDTGTLRGDLLAYLRTVSDVFAGFLAVAAAVSLSGLLEDAGLSPGQVRDRVMAAQQLPSVRTLYQRAHDRGEIDLERVPPSVLALPFDLARHDLIMERRPLEPARLHAIVDELFLPLIGHHETDPRRAERR